MLRNSRGLQTQARGKSGCRVRPLRVSRPAKVWAREFTLLKGHTLKTVEMGGSFMKIWNATIRRGAQGPYIEFRSGALVQQDLANGSQLKIDAWGY